MSFVIIYMFYDDPQCSYTKRAFVDRVVFFLLFSMKLLLLDLLDFANLEILFMFGGKKNLVN